MENFGTKELMLGLNAMYFNPNLSFQSSSGSEKGKSWNSKRK